LIGAFDNEWTMKVTQNLRYRFVLYKDVAQGQIVDTKGMSKDVWANDFGQRYSQISKDYAVVAIISDSIMGQPVVIAAGLGPNGTTAAAEFLSNRNSIDKVRRLARKDWNGRNFEIVLSTQVINSNSGPPQIVGAEFW
jgi:hypothetical protein